MVKNGRNSQKGGGLTFGKNSQIISYFFVTAYHKGRGGRTKHFQNPGIAKIGLTWILPVPMPVPVSINTNMSTITIIIVTFIRILNSNILWSTRQCLGLLEWLICTWGISRCIVYTFCSFLNILHFLLSFCTSGIRLCALAYLLLGWGKSPQLSLISPVGTVWIWNVPTDMILCEMFL